jgi:hypothetical protein
VQRTLWLWLGVAMLSVPLVSQWPALLATLRGLA